MAGSLPFSECELHSDKLSLILISVLCLFLCKFPRDLIIALNLYEKEDQTAGDDAYGHTGKNISWGVHIKI